MARGSTCQVAFELFLVDTHIQSNVSLPISLLKELIVVGAKEQWQVELH